MSAVYHHFGVADGSSLGISKPEEFRRAKRGLVKLNGLARAFYDEIWAHRRILEGICIHNFS
jgi:hypothetical protein